MTNNSDTRTIRLAWQKHTVGNGSTVALFTERKWDANRDWQHAETIEAELTGEQFMSAIDALDQAAQGFGDYDSNSSAYVNIGVNGLNVNAEELKALQEVFEAFTA